MNVQTIKIARLAPAQSKGTMPPSWVLDKIAEEKITGGFKIGKNRSNVCAVCNQARSVSGACDC